ncbi:hypothetical protein [Prauserella muralis]|uniref:Uncharacterized protein n=1 Tax=Prauserella muralis TaxID=588067 RepID=A0A2V4AMK3_9PSEU|nr:hypothetical protein [Prauserella muralis]PXY20849.1 hypothetical protein BAY60_25430 [Prauserella muralis]TWE29886.1 hypothetical protein FHX69_2578 [Prauserella muralis]
MADKSFHVVPTTEEAPGYRDAFPLTVVDEFGKIHGRARDREEAEARRAVVEWEHSLPVGQRTTSLLSEVRAVHSKARTTIQCAERRGDPDNPYGVDPLDFEDREILADLRSVVNLLDRWKRTGRPPRMPAHLKGAPRD